MTSCKKLIVYGSLGLLVLTYLGGAYFFHACPIYVNVVNGRPQWLSNTRVTYRYGELGIGTLEPGESRGGYVLPWTETSLRLSYEVNGVAKDEKVDTYMEPGFRGRVDIVITDERTIVRDKVYLVFIP